MNTLKNQSVGRRVTSVCWLPPRAGSAYTDTELYFVTGLSGSRSKELVLWTTENPDFKSESESKPVPPVNEQTLATQVVKAPHDGDVQDIATVSSDVFATASSYGTVSIYDVHHGTSSASDSMLKLRESVTAHRFANGEPAVSTALAAQPVNSSDAEIASCGEDGRIAYVPLSRLDALQAYEVDSTVVTGVCWPTPAQVAASTRAGQIKMFDRRSSAEVSAVFLDPSSSYSLECIASHPSQSFRLAAGTDTGTIMVWDIRNPKKPHSEVLNVHKSNVWKVQYHPADSSKIVSCSDDATMAITQWAMDNDTASTSARDMLHMSSFFNVLSIGCFDVCPFTSTNLLVAGTDSGNILMEKSPATGI
ncbi:Nucleoporin Nup43 [Coemansia sp. BCRC 34301]|nr:Nucleoporin Nup43 [Coemansia sp. BCRC 34301]